MASVVDIANLALSHIGDRATVASIDPPEGSAQADHCARWWPIARDEALSRFDWGFASRSVATALLSDSVQDDTRWRFAYARPADFITARELTYTNGHLVQLAPGSPLFEDGTLADGTPVIFAASDVASLRYTRRVSDPSRYPPLFVTAVSFLLASYLAGPVIKGRAGVGTAEAMRKNYEMKLSEAKMLDANQRHNTTAFKPASVRARGTHLEGQTIENGPYRYELPYWAQS